MTTPTDRSGTYASGGFVTDPTPEFRRERLRRLLSLLQDDGRPDCRRWSGPKINRRGGPSRFSLSHMVGPGADRDPGHVTNLQTLAIGLCIGSLDRMRDYLNGDGAVEAMARRCRAGLAARDESEEERKLSR